MNEYLRPRNLPEALAMRDAHPDYWVLAGGTDLMVDARQRPAPRGILDLFGLKDLTGISERGGAISIGGATPYAQILANPLVRRHLPILTDCVREIGAVQIQERGTLAGNLATSSPVGDTLPVLLALDALVDVASLSGTRTVAYRDFCTGYRRTALKPDELIVTVRMPIPEPGTRLFWRKVGTRRAQAISKVMIAAAAALDKRGRVAWARIGLGAVADRPVRSSAAENALTGKAPDEGTAARVKSALEKSLQPIDDVRSTARYRRHVAGNLAARFVLSLAEAA